MKSGYIGIIPKDVRHHPKLKPNAKVLYAEIMALLTPFFPFTYGNYQLIFTPEFPKIST